MRKNTFHNGKKPKNSVILYFLFILIGLVSVDANAQALSGLSLQYGVNLNEPTPISDIVSGYKYPVLSPEIGIQYDFKRF